MNPSEFSDSRSSVEDGLYFPDVNEEDPVRIFVSGLLVAFVGLCVLAFLRSAPSDVREVEVEVEPEVEVEVLPPYRHGYDSGYRSFLAQMGEEIPKGRVSSYMSRADGMDEEYLRGYVDGYHRATEAYRCPRGNCPY